NMNGLISIFDLTRADIEAILESAAVLKEERRGGSRRRDDLEGRILALIFEKPSTRTRISFEVAMLELGGDAISLNWNELQLGRGERIKETAEVLSSYLDAVMIRAYAHSTIEEFARYASIPVINGLSDLEHPCQTLADLMTIREYKKKLSGIKVAWVGDGNNVCNSLIGGCALMGMELSIACPEGFEPAEQVIRMAEAMGAVIHISEDVKEAVTDADVIYTDVWVSMGDEADRARREEALRDYQVNEGVVAMAKEDVIVMHCMPVHVGEELTEAVLNSEEAVILEQAENRLHAQKALLLKLLK
ncbi:MAG: ornithine carbamoyltransferase, partial [Methanophagales archaeon]|nr:ornithine carbamoyltransferase [Methanophagales archaeon]